MRVLLSFLFVLAFGGLSGQLTLVVNALPLNTPDDPQVFVAGNFQGWDAGAPDYELSDMGDGTFSLTFSPEPGLLEFKFTRGSWETVEGNENGGFLPNRTLNYDGGELTETMQILSWEDIGGENSSAADNVFVIDDAFYIPQLDRYRRVWIYLPPDYDMSELDYKVLYMHDGQNVFDVATSFVGEWEVDETLNLLFEDGDPGCIVVAVDNGGIHRIDEYSPWVNPDYGGGQGDLYMQFLVNTLKPYIDENYRTLADRENTGIMGSSMGGLISNYGGIEYSDVYSRIGSFSPAYWFSNDTYTHTAEAEVAGDMRIYTIAGALEGVNMTEGVQLMEAEYVGAGYSDDEYTSIIHDDGQHSEWYWAREFEDAYLWLWPGVADAIENSRTEAAFRVFPNPAGDTIYVQGQTTQELVSLEILSADGKLLQSYSVWPDSIDLTAISGNVIVSARFANGEAINRLVIR